MKINRIFPVPTMCVLLLTLILMVSCGTAEPTAQPLPATATRIARAATSAPLPPTATPVPPTATSVPPTAIPPDSRGAGLITFYSDRDGNPEIYVMNPDGSDQRRLTFGPYLAPFTQTGIPMAPS